MKEVEFYRQKLDNGITVVFEKRELPVIAVSSSIKFGAQYENEKIKGISHFIEHLVFKGTKNRTVTQIPEEIESKGGIINAFTGEEITCFWNKLPSKYFDLGADISRDLILNPLFEEKALERERKVILEEIKMYHDNPSAYVMDKLKELLYKKPFNLSVAGTLESVSKISRQEVIDTFNLVYSPNNMIFNVVGKADWQEVLDEANKFPKINKKINSIPIIKSSGELIEKRKGIDQAHVVMGFHMPKINEKERYASEIFDVILGGGMSSRLFQEVREKRGLCYAIKSHLEQSKDYSYLVIYAGTVKEKIKELKDLCLKEVKKIEILKQKDLDEAKERLIGQRKINSERSDGVMVELLEEELGGNAENYYKYEEEVEKVKIEDVRKLGKLKEYSSMSLIPD